MMVNFPIITTTPSIRPLSKSAFGVTQPASVTVADKVNAEEIKTDSSEIKQEPVKKEKRGLIRRTKDFIRAIKKFGISFSEYTKGAIGGLFGGALLGGTVFGAGHIVNSIKKHGKDVVRNEKGKYFKQSDAVGYSVQKMLEADPAAVQEGTTLDKIYQAAKKVVGKDLEQVINKEIDPSKLEKYDKAFANKIKKVGIEELSVAEKDLFTASKQILKKMKFIPAKTLGALVGVTVLLSSLWKASLNANERKADVDHRYTTTPIISK